MSSKFRVQKPRLISKLAKIQLKLEERIKKYGKIEKKRPTSHMKCIFRRKRWIYEQLGFEFFNNYIIAKHKLINSKIHFLERTVLLKKKYRLFRYFRREDEKGDGRKGLGIRTTGHLVRWLRAKLVVSLTRRTRPRINYLLRKAFMQALISHALKRYKILPSRIKAIKQIRRNRRDPRYKKYKPYKILPGLQNKSN